MAVKVLRVILSKIIVKDMAIKQEEFNKYNSASKTVKVDHVTSYMYDVITSYDAGIAPSVSNK